VRIVFRKFAKWHYVFLNKTDTVFRLDEGVCMLVLLRPGPHEPLMSVSWPTRMGHRWPYWIGVSTIVYVVYIWFFCHDNRTYNRSSAEQSLSHCSGGWSQYACLESPKINRLISHSSDWPSMTIQDVREWIGVCTIVFVVYIWLFCMTIELTTEAQPNSLFLIVVAIVNTPLSSLFFCLRFSLRLHSTTQTLTTHGYSLL
jgi:hypothetical protein